MNNIQTVEKYLMKYHMNIFLDLANRDGLIVTNRKPVHAHCCAIDNDDSVTN